MGIEVVWLKKDLRITDHRPLFEATKNKTALALYIYENEFTKQPEYSEKHIQFISQSLYELQARLNENKIPFLITSGDTLEILKKIHRKYDIKKLHSHLETGTYWTYQRDKKVRNFCHSNSILWNEYNQFATQRGAHINRDEWNCFRTQTIERPLVKSVYPEQVSLKLNDFKQTSPMEHINSRLIHLQSGGEVKAQRLLNSFLNSRYNSYQKNISSPLGAWNSCSRLSPYITWGNLSISQIHQALTEKILQLKSEKPFSNKSIKNLESFNSRLWWHCHFIQKLETEPEIEFRNINTGFDILDRDSSNNQAFKAWSDGETGFPIIDACMRALKKHGWINFRMRAMLVSFATNHLWLDWKRPAWHLAQLFTDFEPGIHFSQIQMQSGTTGINTIRIYSPIKQSKDQDPNGEFIKKFIPELAQVDPLYIHQPELMPPLIQQISGCLIGKTYPAPIVCHKSSYAMAKEKLFTIKNNTSVRLKSKTVYKKHGSRKNKHFSGKKR